MLCMKEEDGLQIYIHNNGLTLCTGSQLYIDQLRLPERYTAVLCQSHEDWFYDQGNKTSLGPEAQAPLRDFVAALKDAPFLFLEDIPLEKDAISVFDSKERFHLYFQMDDGLTLHLRLLEGGYVYFDGLNGVCVQMDAQPFEALMACLAEE